MSEVFFMDKKQKYLPILIFSAVSLGVGGLSALLTAGNMKIFDSVKMPPLSPPAAVFPIVWTVLYALMGVSAGRVWQKKDLNRRFASAGLEIFALSLAFNFFWSIFFFNCKAFLFSFAWLVLLFVQVLFTVIFYRRVDRLAGNLQIPYLLWVAFAGYLNFGIFLLNR